MGIQPTVFVFKREGEQFKVAQDQLSDGSRCKARRIGLTLQSIPVQHPEHSKISQCSELKVSLVASFHSVIRIQNSENGLDVIFAPQTPVAAFESFTEEAFSQLEKPAKVRELVKFVQELRKKDIAQDQGILIFLNSFIQRIDELLTCDDPIVEKTLEEILSQRDALLTCADPSILREKIQQLYDDVKIALNRLEIAELALKVKAREAELNNAKSAFKNATQSLSVRLKDLCGFIGEDTPDRLQQNQVKNNENLQRHEANLVVQSQALAEVEDLLPVRTPFEQKAKINEFISKFAGTDSFQVLLKFLDSLNKVSDLLKEYKDAYFWKKPILMAQMMTYGPTLKSSIEELEKKLPERAFGSFIFLIADSFSSVIKDVFGDAFVQSLPDLRTELVPQANILRQRVSIAKTEIEQCKDKAQQIPLLLKIVQDRKELQELYQRSPEAKEEILRLENTEYQISGTLLEERRNWRVPENNPIEQRLRQLGKKEIEEAQKVFVQAKNHHDIQCKNLDDRLQEKNRPFKSLTNTSPKS